MLKDYNLEELGALLTGRAALAVASAAHCAFLVNGLLSLPFYLYPAQVRAWLAAVAGVQCGGQSHSEVRLPPIAARFDTATKRAMQRSLWDELPGESASARMSDTRSFALTNISSLAACALLAMVVPDVEKPLTLLGGTAVGAMAFLFPGALILRSPELRRSYRAFAWVFLVLGAAQGLVSIASQFA